MYRLLRSAHLFFTQLTLFTVRRNARSNACIASAVLATAIVSICPSVRLSVCLSHAAIVSKWLHVARCSLHSQIAKCVWPTLSWKQRCSMSMVRASKKSWIMTNMKSYTGFPTSHQPRFYAAPKFLKMGIKYLKFIVFHTILTIKDEKSAAKFHYIKTVWIWIGSAVFAQLTAENPYTLQCTLKHDWHVTKKLIAAINYWFMAKWPLFS